MLNRSRSYSIRGLKQSGSCIGHTEAGVVVEPVFVRIIFTARRGSLVRRFHSRYYNFASLDSLRAFVTRRQPEDATLAGFDNSVRAWARGGEYVHLTAVCPVPLEPQWQNSHLAA